MWFSLPEQRRLGCCLLTEFSSSHAPAITVSARGELSAHFLANAHVFQTAQQPVDGQ
jgi:hypothetical protein